tara:strand:+ start:1343 stop:1504 length:162 start_codon:yes stop_codon:yes gene_type:complete
MITTINPCEDLARYMSTLPKWQLRRIILESNLVIKKAKERTKDKKYREGIKYK